MPSYSDLAYLVDLISQLTNGTAPWWYYIIIAFIPFSILIAVREAYCWFNKVNSVTSKLERIEKRLKEVTTAVNNLAHSISQQQLEICKSEKFNTQKSQNNETEEKFYLDKDWTKK